MTNPKELDIVKIVQLDRPQRTFTGADGVLRQPQIGDVGTLVLIQGAGTEDETFTVECVAEDGHTIWLADFAKDEIETICSEAPTDKIPLRQTFIQAGAYPKIKKAANILTNFFCCGVMLLVWLLCGVCSLLTLLTGGNVSFMDITDSRVILTISLIVTIGLFLLFAVPFVKGLFGTDKSQRE